jgi:hypothetical protein
VNTTVYIDDDSVAWQLTADQADILRQAAIQNGVPTAVNVVAPQRGRLIISPRASGSIALLTEPTTVGWVPSDVILTTPRLYVPGQTSTDIRQLGYALAAGTDLNALEQNLIAALQNGTTVQLEVNSPPAAGHVLLNGAALSHLVLIPAHGQLTTGDGS